MGSTPMGGGGRTHHTQHAGATVGRAPNTPTPTQRPYVSDNSTRSSLDNTPIQLSQTAGGAIGEKFGLDKARQRAITRDNQIRKSAKMAISKQAQCAEANHIRVGGGGRTGWSAARGESPSNAVRNYELCEAETILESNTVVEAARHMAAKRLDFVLVVDGMERLVGIVTDRDLAFRVIAEGLDPRTTAVAQVMTRQPQCAQANTSMVDALTKMVQNHFRHLPVLEGEDRIIGVLDIAKCLYDALQKLELADAAATQIATALESVGREFGRLVVAAAGNQAGAGGEGCALSFADTIRDQLASPKLSSILGDQPSTEQCVIANAKCTVQAAVRQMRTRKATAALVADENGQGLLGIFTTKDVLLRVVAAGLDPATTSIIRVMTPHPDVVTPDTSIVSALRQMHHGHYLHLPVLTIGSKSIVGIADVLQLTYEMLERLSALQGKSQTPLWHRLWSTPEEFSSAAFEETESATGTVSAYSERHSERHSEIQPPLSLQDTNITPRPRSLLEDTLVMPIGPSWAFKIRHGSQAILLPAEHLQPLPTLRDLEIEAQARFNLPDGSVTLGYLDDKDVIPIRNDAELNSIVRLMQNSGQDRITLVVQAAIALEALADNLLAAHNDQDQVKMQNDHQIKKDASSGSGVIVAATAAVAAGLTLMGLYWLRAMRA